MQLIAKKNSPLIELLTLLAPESSKTTLRSWIKDSRVTVDDIVVKRADTLVLEGQKVNVRAKSGFAPKGIRILYADHHLVVVEKPAEMLSVAAAFEKTETVYALLKKHFHKTRLYVVHRLDQETSGVMLFAFSEKCYLGLKKLFETHAIERTYCAIVEGHLESPSGTWKSYLKENSLYIVYSTKQAGEGALAITHYQTLGTSPQYTRLELKLETGRKNQIRVHCTDNGHPVVGDKKYGSTKDPLKRLCLHAKSLAFTHPIERKEMRFISPVPQEFDRLVKEQLHA